MFLVSFVPIHVFMCVRDAAGCRQMRDEEFSVAMLTGDRGKSVRETMCKKICVAFLFLSMFFLLPCCCGILFVHLWTFKNIYIIKELNAASSK